MSTFQRKLKRLSAKNWSALRTFWLDHIPELSTVHMLEETLQEDEVLCREMKSVEKDGEHRFEPDVSFAPQLFAETVFVVHKAVRVACEAAREVVDGLPTWSISTAHHGNMFALRAFLGLCGVAYLEVDNRRFLLDVQPAKPKGQRTKARGLASSGEVQLIEVSRMQHREWWMVYQRILNASGGAFGCWPFPIDAQLPRCDVKGLSRDRNELHYRLKWFHEDLFGRSSVRSFGVYSDEVAGAVVERLEDEEGSDATLILNQVLLGNCLAMLADLGETSRRVKEVVETIDSVVNQLTNEVLTSWYGKVSQRSVERNAVVGRSGDVRRPSHGL